MGMLLIEQMQRLRLDWTGLKEKSPSDGHRIMRGEGVERNESTNFILS